MNAAATISDVPEKTLFSEKLGRAIRLGWEGSQAELASAIGVSRQSLNQYIGEKPSVPKTRTIFLLAQKLGVSLSWLLDESDTQVDPVWTASSPLLKEANYRQFFADGERRYREVAVAFEHLLTIEIDKGCPWTKVASCVLFPHDPDDLPEPTKQAIARFDLIDSLAYQVKRLSSFHERYWSDRMYPMRRQIDGRALYPEALEQQFDRFRAAQPGYDAVAMYSAAQFESVFQVEPRLNFYWFAAAPYYLARIVIHESSEGWPGREPLRKELKKWGFIQKTKGVEVAAEKPDSWPWPMVTKRDSDLMPWDDFFRKRHDWRELGPMPPDAYLANDMMSLFKRKKK